MRLLKIGSFIGFFLISMNTAFAIPYSDVTQSHKYYVAINEFTNQAIIEGYSDATFKPDQPINRAEALKIILKAFKIDTEELGTENFSDVSESDWFYDYILQGLKHEIVKGYEDGTFKPANQVLLSESLKMGLEADGIEIESIDFTDFHPSIISTDWFAKYFSHSFIKNFISLDSNGGLNPIRAMDRGEFVDLIYKFQTTATDSEFDISYNWQEESVENGLSIAFPFEWTQYSLGEGIFLGYFADQKPSFINNVTNGARISVNFWQNTDIETANDYFLKLKADYEKKYTPSKIDFSEVIRESGSSMSVLVKDKGIYDYYIYLEQNRFLYAEGSFDFKSLKALDLVKEIEKIYEKLKFDPKLNLSADQKLEYARKNIYVAGQGLEVLDLFISKELFKTDSIGFGTGPVDYYYLTGADTTVVYERNSDAILGVLEGKTDIFSP